jgi:hypothetical protein
MNTRNVWAFLAATIGFVGCGDADPVSGDLVGANLLDADGTPTLMIDRHDFRDTSGSRFPHRVTYLAGHEKLLATEVFDEYAIDAGPVEREQETVSH